MCSAENVFGIMMFISDTATLCCVYERRVEGNMDEYKKMKVMGNGKR